MSRFTIGLAAILSLTLLTVGCGDGAIVDAPIGGDTGGGADGAGPRDDGGGSKDVGVKDAGGGDTGEPADAGDDAGADAGDLPDAGGCAAGNEPCAVREDCCNGLVCPSGTCQPSVCGDGFVDPKRLEECDDQNGAAGDGCEPDCKYTCLSTDAARDCASQNPCVDNGICDDATTHTCTPGKVLDDGTTCDTGSICLTGICGASACGDGYVDAVRNEQCEDGNNTAGDGCEPGSCRYSCGDAAADCVAAPACRKNQCTAGHTCEAVADAAQNGNSCGNGLVCNNGSCEPPAQLCGNGTREGIEECDDGNQTEGDGCEPGACAFTCHVTASDCAAAPACNAAVCADVLGGGGAKVGQRCALVPAHEGQSDTGCAAPSTCKSGTCTPPGVVCGNGAVETGEECDYGQGLNAAGSGCEPNCKLSCKKTPADTCLDANPCNGAEACTDVTVNGKAGQKCAAGTALGDGTVCGTGNVCLGGACRLSICGDAFTDAAAGEQCDFGTALNFHGSGCEPDCAFTCVNPAADCPAAPACRKNQCTAAHACEAVADAAQDGAACGVGFVCSAGSCQQAVQVCGNGTPEGTEECDDGNQTPADGCEPVTCMYTCHAAASDCTVAPVCNAAVCVDVLNGSSVKIGQKCGTVPASEGLSVPDCAAPNTCKSGTCTSPTAVCGNGAVETGEDCDYGQGLNTAGSGCEPNCRFSCVKTPADSCLDANPCNGVEACGDVTVNGKPGQACAGGSALGDGTACGAGNICLSGACRTSVCGDAYVDAARGEQCEDGNAAPGDGCEPITCRWSCSDPVVDCAASPAPTCKKNQCSAAHACEAVADAAQDGNTCGNGLICSNGDCVPPAQVCGNGTPEGAEECDDGNQTTADGCEPVTCAYSCHTPAADCAVAPVCNAAVCEDVMSGLAKVGQKCGTVPANEGQSPAGCDTPNTCKNGTCTPPAVVCGNGAVESGEDCDYGPGLNTAGSGCEPNCKFTCAKTPTDSCPDANPCNGVETCGDVTVNGRHGQKCSAGSALADGTSCGGGNICVGGACVLSTCGDAITDGNAGEQCDFGTGFNLAGSGCEPNCHLSCAKAPIDSCPDANPCNGAEACTDVTVNGHPGQHCVNGSPMTLGDSCGAGTLICAGTPLTCKASACGDSYINGATGEQCEPPNTSTCDAACHTVVPARCGDNILSAGEQCDDNDGTPGNLDGCDTACRYEMMLRMNAVSISGATAPTGCTPTTNRFGRNVIASSLVRGQLNTSLQDGVDQGDTNVILQMLGLDDLTGVNDAAMQMGIMTGDLDPAKGAWPGTNPIDWWYLIAPSNLDANDLPNSKFTTAAIAARAITAGPNDVTMSLLMGGSPMDLLMRDAHLFATVDNPPVPNVPAAPPTLLQAGVTVMQSINGTVSGKGLCGNITVESLSKIPLPELLATGGSFACQSCSGSKVYTYCGSGQPVGATCNSMLDAIVGGCKAVSCLVAVLNATQPDVAGGGPYQGALSVSGTYNKVPDNQTAGNLRAYSAFLNFTANRAHATGKMP